MLDQVLGGRSLEGDAQLGLVHIVKTAGTSFTEILKSLFGNEHVLQIHYSEFENEGPQNFDQYKAICGHFPYEMYKLLNRKPVLMTFLRNPIDRSISHYQHFDRKPEPHHLVDRQQGKTTIEEYTSDPALQLEFMNLQTRFLGLKISSPVRSLRDMRPLEEIDGRTVNVELAKERLRQLAFLGLTEKFEESMHMFAYTMGLPPFRYQPRVNVAPNKLKKSQISKQVMERLHELNQLDLELYAYGRELFEGRYARMIAELSRRFPEARGLAVEDLLEKNFWLNYWEQNPEPLCSLKYDLRPIFPQAGWHPPEEVDKRRWTWSGPGRTSRIDLPLDRTRPLRISLQILHFATQDILESLKLSLDKQHIVLTHIKDQDGAIIFRGTIPPAAKNKPKTSSRLGFSVNRTVYPPGVDSHTAGARLLGVALSWIEISP